MSQADTISKATDAIDVEIQYLRPTSLINRRFWAPGAEYNTGEYDPYPVTIRNARKHGPFNLDEHGFALGHHQTDITDWEGNYAADSAYSAQVRDQVMKMTGADLVVNMGGMVRTSGKTSDVWQPPAGEAHVDFTTKSARKIAEMIYRGARPEGKGYDRFICFSLWRVLSDPPQNWPLALCDGSSVGDDEGTHNTKVDVDEIPTGDALFAPIEGEEDMVAATIFHHSPDHRWYYYPDMTRDEVILIKFHDSDHSRTWRCPHTAFHDTTRPDANIRKSMEFRGVAYFTRDGDK